MHKDGLNINIVITQLIKIYCTKYTNVIQVYAGIYRI